MNKHIRLGNKIKPANCEASGENEIQCPECKLESNLVEYGGMFQVTGSGYGVVGLRCICGCNFGVYETDISE